MRQSVLRLLLLLTVAALFPATAWGQEAAEESYSRFRHFRIPFKVGPGAERLRELRLFVSTDRGLTWNQIDTALPSATEFRFRTERDGVFWFSVQTVDQNGQAIPPAPSARDVTLKVIVDLQPPVVTLRPAEARPNQVGVRWDIRDDNIDPRPEALHLEYRAQNGNGPWKLLRITSPVPQIYWTPESAEPLEVRLKASDKAGNIGEDATVVSLGANQGGGFAGGQGATAPRQSYQAPIEVQRKLVNKKQVTLQCQVDQVGKSGVSVIEVYYLRQGGDWQKLEDFSVKNPPDKKVAVRLEFPEDGVYGVTLLAKSGVGLSEPPPKQGNAPQVWVEVDTVAPMVENLRVDVGTGSQRSKLLVYWRASDKNLKAQPITLSYSENPKDGTWTKITPQPVANTSSYIWNMPADVPSQFYVRVEAADRAGNIGQAITQEAVRVDLSIPRTKIIQIESN
jgi:hypothetical protein